MRTARIDDFAAAERQRGGYPSLAVAVVKGGERYAAATGLADVASGRSATVSTDYFVGSLTKAYTATLLGILAAKEYLSLGSPVARLLPPGVRVPRDIEGKELTLYHLVTHTSGLPRLPANLVATSANPYGAFGAGELYRALGGVELQGCAGTAFAYSHLGYGVLGHALALAMHRPFGDLLADFLLKPLGSSTTAIWAPDAPAPSLATGYRPENGGEAAAWDAGSLAGSGQLVTNAADVAMFLDLHLNGFKWRCLGFNHVEELRRLHAAALRWGEAGDGVALGWHLARDAELGDYLWQSGMRAGGAGFAAVAPQRQVAAAVLINMDHPNVDQLGLTLLRAVLDA